VGEGMENELKSTDNEREKKKNLKLPYLDNRFQHVAKI